MAIYHAALVEAKRIAAVWTEAKSPTYSASVAYYTMFSIAPLLLIAIAFVGLFFDQDMARAAIMQEFSGTFGRESASFVGSLLDSDLPKSGNALLLAAGFAAVLLGASGVFSQLKAALDAIFGSAPEKAAGIWKALRKKLLSIGMVMSVGFLLLASLAASAIVTSLSGWLASAFPAGDILARIAELTASFLLISIFLAIIYRFLPSKKLGNKASLIGGCIAGAFFIAGKYVLGLYLGSSAPTSGYGSASALVLIILWSYYMSQIFFLSAILLKLYVIGVPDGIRTHDLSRDRGAF